LRWRVSGRLFCLGWRQSGRRGSHDPRPPTPPDVLDVSGGSPCGCSSARVSAGQGSFSVQRRGCLPLLKRSRSGSAFSARVGAHALPTGSTCLAVAPHPSSISVCSLPQRVRPFFLFLIIIDALCSLKGILTKNLSRHPLLEAQHLTSTTVWHRFAAGANVRASVRGEPAPAALFALRNSSARGAGRYGESAAKPHTQPVLSLGSVSTRCSPPRRSRRIRR
jgi:hypothetical protein